MNELIEARVARLTERIQDPNLPADERETIKEELLLATQQLERTKQCAM